MIIKPNADSCVMHARITGMRAQRGNSTELDPLGHPGKRHGGVSGKGWAKVCRSAAEITPKGCKPWGGRVQPECKPEGPRFAPKSLNSRRYGANCNPYFRPGASEVARVCSPHTKSPGRNHGLHLIIPHRHKDAGIRIMEHCSQAGMLKAPPRNA